MKIKLTTGYSYDTDNKHRRQALLNYIPTLSRRRKAELPHIAAQLRKAAILSPEELKIYDKATGTYTEPVEFTSCYHQASLEERRRSDNRFTFINKKCYRLPKADKEEDVKYALLTKYRYERMRHTETDPICVELKKAIAKVFPEAKDLRDDELKILLDERETEAHTYYGECISDDSDSDEERDFQDKPDISKKKLLTARQHSSRAGFMAYCRKMDGKSKVPSIDYKVRAKITRDDDFNNKQRRQVIADLKAINACLENHGKLPSDFLAKLKTKFVVAQYRGIHYTTSWWDMVARREHRAIDEVGKPQYSSAVLHSSGVKSYHDMINRLKNEPGFAELLVTNGNRLEKQLLRMQHSQPVVYNGYTYASLFHLLQNWYSADYAGIVDKLAKDLEQGEKSLFKPYLSNHSRPLLSTADIPYHALKYAYGIKLYKGYKDERLRPRWRKNGRAERPHSGKVYVSLHPLSDYTEYNPSHITSWFRSGLAKLSSLISSERETSFLGFLRGKRVVIQHKAKYPSFKIDGKYKKIFEVKYGINEAMFEKLKDGFKKFAPHSPERKNLKLMLGEYLCAYHEVRLIAEAEQKAKSMGAVLIYRDEHGSFARNEKGSIELNIPPDTPHTANKRLCPLIMAERKLNEALSPSKTKQVAKLIQKEATKTLASKLPGDKNEARRSRVRCRLFEDKSNYNADNEIVPVRTRVQGISL